MMTSDSFFATLISSLIALGVGSIILLAGYRFFLFLLPVCGFVFGFGLGVQTIHALFGEAFLATIASWAVGFVIALVFAVLSYLFYIFAVGLLGGSLGYTLAVGLLTAIGLDFGFFVWTVGVAAGAALGIAVVVLNVQKYVIIAATAVLGAAVILGTFLFMFSGQPEAELLANPVRVAIQSSFFWGLSFILLVMIGATVQYMYARTVELAAYNRVAEVTGASEPLTTTPRAA